MSGAGAPLVTDAARKTTRPRASLGFGRASMARLSFRSLWRKREAPCASSAPPAPSYSQESVREVRAQQSHEELPPWTPRSAIEAPHPVMVPDDAPSSAEPSPARPSSAQVSRWSAQIDGPVEAAVLSSAKKVGPLPWESGSARGDTSEREDGGSELPSPVPSPNGVAPRPHTAQFCSVCASLYTTAVCRCSMLAFKHPITRIVSQTGQSSPGGSLTWLTPEAVPSAPDTPNKRGRAQRALWSASGEGGAAAASTDTTDATEAMKSEAAGAGQPSPVQPVPHVFVSLCDGSTFDVEDELTV